MTNQANQSPVEWMYHQLFNLKTNTQREFSSPEMILKQAKELDKQRTMQAYSDGLGNGIAVGQGECSFESVADEEQYYQQVTKL